MQRQSTTRRMYREWVNSMLVEQLGIDAKAVNDLIVQKARVAQRFSYI